jgi:hypothetical protein
MTDKSAAKPAQPPAVVAAVPSDAQDAKGGA